MLKGIAVSGKLRLIFILTITYAAIAFAYSLVGFLSPETIELPPTFESLSGLLVEEGGHFTFGAVAALPYWDPTLIVLSGALAIAIDADHITHSPLDRSAHSILFIVPSVILLAFSAKRLGAKNGSLAKIVFAAPISFLSHLAYDVFAAYELLAGEPKFPLLIPLSFSMISLPRMAWSALEAAALLVALLAQLFSLTYRSSSPCQTHRFRINRPSAHTKTSKKPLANLPLRQCQQRIGTLASNSISPI